MSEKKEINRLFQERFKDFEPVTPPGAWDNIENQLPPKRKKRKAAWIFYSGIAAGLAMLFSLFYYSTYSTQAIEKSQLVNEDPATMPELEGTGVHTITNRQSQSSNARSVTSTGTDRTSTQNAARDPLKAPNTSNDNTFNTIVINEKAQKSDQDMATINTPADSQSTAGKTGNQRSTITKNNAVKPASKLRYNKDLNIGNLPSTTPTAVVENGTKAKTTTQKNPETSFKNQSTKKHPVTIGEASIAAVDQSEALVEKRDTLSNKLIEDALAQQELESDTLDIKALDRSRFRGSTLIAPVYSNAGGSSLNNTVANNERSAGYNLSYGVALGYELNNRWSIRAGVHKVDVSYNTQNVRYGEVTQPSAPASGIFNHTDVSSAVGPSGISSSAGFAQELVSNSFQGLNGELSQQLGYIEVPLEVRYNLINSRIKVSMTGGFSALFLQENSVRIVGDNQRLELGSDDNFKEFNQSANFGIGLDYGITDQLGIMLEPMFKYQLGALESNTAGFRPYTIALYSGLTFSF
jgi:hypothetical protein